VFGFGFAFFLVIVHNFPEVTNTPIEISVHYIGRQMLNYGSGGYVLPFEVVSILLLAALIGSIAIAFKTKKNV
jgi:NADH-quinone oxidoreductase subunit J